MVGKDFAKVEQAAQLRHVQQLFVEVVGEALKNQQVCVCVLHMHSRIEVVLQSGIGAVHMEFTGLKYREPKLEGLVDYLIDFVAFDCN